MPGWLEDLRDSEGLGLGRGGAREPLGKRIVSAHSAQTCTRHERLCLFPVRMWACRAVRFDSSQSQRALSVDLWTCTSQTDIVCLGRASQGWRVEGAFS